MIIIGYFFATKHFKKEVKIFVTSKCLTLYLNAIFQIKLKFQIYEFLAKINQCTKFHQNQIGDHIKLNFWSTKNDKNSNCKIKSTLTF